MRHLSVVASLGRHSFSAVVEALLVLAVAIALALGAALATGTNTPAGAGSVFAAKAARSGGHSGSTATIKVPDGVFAGTTMATVSQPGLWVYNACSRGGSVVSQQWAMTDSSGKAVLYLGPTSLWTSGSATCVAQAGTWSNKGTFVSQASTNFSVAA